jgi:hypothetical protein
MTLHRTLGTILVTIAVASPGRSPAAELADGRLYVDAFGGASWSKTDGNLYGTGTEDGGWEASFAVAITSRLYENVTAAGQFELDIDDAAKLDWALVEWRLSDLFRLRAGQVKQPLGIYTEIFDVGTARPFFTLPTSVYGPAGIAAESYLGAGLTGRARWDGGWALEYDVYGGALTLATLEFEEILEAGGPALPYEVEEDLLRELVGGRLTVVFPVRDLSVRFSAYRALRTELETDDAVVQVVWGPSVEFQARGFVARAEYFHRSDPDCSTDAGYVELSQMFGEHFQLALRGEASVDRVETVDEASPFLHHAAVAVGASWWVQPDVVFKASVEGIDGNRFASEGLVGVGESPPSRTWMFVLGTQFSF